jgi:hydrogenase-4 component E
VVGYIVVENGTYTLGMAMVGGVPMLVELGVLMDVFVAVFIMSIATYHISREFEHMDVDQLNRLKG